MSIANHLLDFLPIAYFAGVFISWIIANRLEVGLLFQKQIYVLVFFILFGVALGQAVLLAFPGAEVASETLAAIGMFIGTAQLHKGLLSKVRSPRTWNLVVSAISAVLFVILLLSNM